MVRGPPPGPAPAAQAPRQQLLADPVELAQLAPAEGAQGRGRLDREAQHPSPATGPERIGVIDVVTACQRRHQQRHARLLAHAPYCQCAE